MFTLPSQSLFINISCTQLTFHGDLISSAPKLRFLFLKFDVLNTLIKSCFQLWTQMKRQHFSFEPTTNCLTLEANISPTLIGKKIKKSFFLLSTHLFLVLRGCKSLLYFLNNFKDFQYLSNQLFSIYIFLENRYLHSVLTIIKKNQKFQVFW